MQFIDTPLGQILAALAFFGVLFGFTALGVWVAGKTDQYREKWNRDHPDYKSEEPEDFNDW